MNEKTEQELKEEALNEKKEQIANKKVNEEDEKIKEFEALNEYERELEKRLQEREQKVESKLNKEAEEEKQKIEEEIEKDEMYKEMEEEIERNKREYEQKLNRFYNDAIEIYSMLYLIPEDGEIKEYSEKYIKEGYEDFPVNNFINEISSMRGSKKQNKQLAKEKIEMYLGDISDNNLVKNLTLWQDMISEGKNPEKYFKDLSQKQREIEEEYKSIDKIWSE